MISCSYLHALESRCQPRARDGDEGDASCEGMPAASKYEWEGSSNSDCHLHLLVRVTSLVPEIHQPSREGKARGLTSFKGEW